MPRRRAYTDRSWLLSRLPGTPPPPPPKDHGRFLALPEEDDDTAFVGKGEVWVGPPGAVPPAENTRAAWEAAGFQKAEGVVDEFVPTLAAEEKQEGDPRPSPVQDLIDWWTDLAAEEVGKITDKMTEYGGSGRAVDLIDIGRDLARGQGREVDDAEAAELGIYFYLRGKMSRWTAAMIEGRPVSDDTLHDIGVYVRMAQRIREVGGWPV